ncbi:hypothetical protein PENSPDRAFT_656088 [Peniophora sp. CONT]|nr:hypothetical protein PENSPDRAFT_656088 [Peniophora sp. CONT]
MQRALEPLSSVEVVSVHGDFGISGILCMMNAFENGPKPLFPKLNTLVVHMRMKPYEFEDWHADCWQAIAELLDHRKRADVPVRELRITGGWRSEKLRQDWFGAEGPHLAKVHSAVEVVRDERMVKYYEEGCDCCDTDLEGESDDENQET